MRRELWGFKIWYHPLTFNLITTLFSGIVRAAEEQIAERMTKRYQKMRLDFLKDICRSIQEKVDYSFEWILSTFQHEEVFKRQVQAFMDQVHERQLNRKRVNELKSELRKLRIQYYTEPIEMERNLTQFRDQILENDQRVGYVESKNYESFLDCLTHIGAQTSERRSKTSRSSLVSKTRSVGPSNSNLWYPWRKI